MRRLREAVAVLVLMAGAGLGWAQQSASTHPAAAPRSTAMVVSGYEGQADVIYRNGHAYVEVEGLARVTQSTLAFQGKSIVLTLPASTIQVTQAAPASPAVPAAAPAEKGFSREFLQAGVEQMTVVREWRSAIENAIRTNNPVDQSWVSGYRSNAQSRMAMATASATTDADRQALPLLQGAMTMMQQLSDRFLALRTTASYVSPDTLDNDPLDQKILACAQGMASQAIPGGQFQDVVECH